jgi:hypothetical protein
MAERRRTPAPLEGGNRGIGDGASLNVTSVAEKQRRRSTHGKTRSTNHAKAIRIAQRWLAPTGRVG